jgi:predicted nucleic acid-binding Zn finger protein
VFSGEEIQEGDNVNAYIRFKDYDPGFYAEAFAKGIKAEQGDNTFESVLRRASASDGTRKIKKTLADGKAMYLYGGRKALVREFDTCRDNIGSFVLKPATGKKLAVFHGKVSTDLGKTKRILMIANTTTNPPPANDGRRLKVDLGEKYNPRTGSGTGHYGFYNLLDLPGLRKLVFEIPD